MKETESNEWVHLVGNIATIGITKKASQELGEVVFVELPTIGQVVKQGEEAAVLESTKAAADSYAPLSGKVIQVNEKIVKKPGLVISDPHGEGWLYRLEIHTPEEYNALSDYTAH